MDTEESALGFRGTEVIVEPMDSDKQKLEEVEIMNKAPTARDVYINVLMECEPSIVMQQLRSLESREQKETFVRRFCKLLIAGDHKFSGWSTDQAALIVGIAAVFRSGDARAFYGAVEDDCPLLWNKISNLPIVKEHLIRCRFWDHIPLYKVEGT